MPIVVTTGGSGGDGAVSGGDADTVDGRHASEFALLTGATFSGNVQARRMIAGNGDGRTTSMLELRGYTSSWAVNVQDGSGRINMRWNASAGSAPKFLVGGGEQAVEWDIDGWGSMGLSVRWASSSGRLAGDPITWTNIMSAGAWGVWLGVPLRLRSYVVADLPPADRGMGMVCYVTDGPAGPCLAVSDGSAWRQVAMGDVL